MCALNSFYEPFCNDILDATKNIALSEKQHLLRSYCEERNLAMKEMILGTSNVSLTAKPNRVVKTVCIKSNLSSNPYAKMEFEIDTLPQDYGYQYTHEIGNPVPI